MSFHSSWQGRWSYTLNSYTTDRTHASNAIFFKVENDKDSVQDKLVNRVERGYWRALTKPLPACIRRRSGDKLIKVKASGSSDAKNPQEDPEAADASSANELRYKIGTFFTRRLGMTLKLDHNLTMLPGSVVTSKHYRIHSVAADGFCLLRAALYHPDSHTHTADDWRRLASEIVSDSFRDTEGFTSRIVNVCTAIEFYMERTSDPPDWICKLRDDLERLQEDKQALPELASMDRETETRKQWEERILVRPM